MNLNWSNITGGLRVHAGTRAIDLLINGFARISEQSSESCCESREWLTSDDSHSSRSPPPEITRSLESSTNRASTTFDQESFRNVDAESHYKHYGNSANYCSSGQRCSSPYHNQPFSEIPLVGNNSRIGFPPPPSSNCQYYYRRFVRDSEGNIGVAFDDPHSLPYSNKILQISYQTPSR